MKIDFNNETFLIINNDQNCYLIIFSCDINLNVLRRSEIIYMYGNFEYCPKLFAKLFFLHGLQNYHCISLLFVLLLDKKKPSTYVGLFQNIIKLFNSRELCLKPNLFIFDFEDVNSCCIATSARRH